MRRSLLRLALTAAFLTVWPLAVGSAQRFGRAVPRPAAPVQGNARSGSLPGQANPLRPYSGDDRPVAARGGNQPGRWSTASVPRESRPSPRASVFNAARSYYPGLRVGQGSNRNVIDPRSLCVPGRRALLVR
ncbi:MAG: hypothetical protein AB7I30_04270 [Isosphaeraceae bacterium]